MKEIYDIFSNKKVKIRDLPTKELQVDIHEKNSLVPSFLSKLNVNYSFEHLEIGDYLVEDSIFERKTFSDFIGSIITKRLNDQLRNLKKYKNHFLIIENFDFNYNNKNIHENAIRGMIVSIISDYKIPIIFSKDCEDTAKFLLRYLKRLDKSQITTTQRLSKEKETTEKQKQFILEGFPGIGPTIAKKLLSENKTLIEIFNSKEEDLAKIERFDKNKIEEFKRILNS